MAYRIVIRKADTLGIPTEPLTWARDDQDRRSGAWVTEWKGNR